MNHKEIYLYDKMPQDLQENGMSLVDFRTPPEINRQLNGMYQFYGVYKGEGQYSDQIEKFKYISAFTPDDKKQFFYILDVEKKNKEAITFKTLHLGYESNNNFIVNSFTSSGTGSTIMNNLFKSLAFDQKFEYSSNVKTVHQFTAKKVNPIEAIIGSNNGQQNLVGVTKGELDMDNYQLILKDRIGEDNGYRIDFGVNLASIVENVMPGNICNSLYLVGGVPEGTQYDHDQDPIEYKYLEVDGVNDSNRIIRKRENQECKTIEDLKKWGDSLFEKDRIHEPKVTHVIDMVSLENTEEYKHIYDQIAKCHIGDTIYCTLQEMKIEVMERMVEYTFYPTLRKYKQVVIGNEFESYSQKTNTQINDIKRNLIVTSESLQKALIEASEMITGNQGGYVVHYPKNNPSDILIMDTPDIATAKQVLRMNKSGIGFSDKGWKGPFKTAWTLDGVLSLGEGKLILGSEKEGKFLENTVNGLELFNEKESIGTIGNAAKNFPGTGDGEDDTSKKALAIKLDKGGEFFKIEGGKSTGIYVPNPDKFTKNGSDLIISHSTTAKDGIILAGSGGSISIYGREVSSKAKTVQIHAKGGLFLNGEQVFPGQNNGSGGNNSGGNLGSREDYAKNLITAEFNVDYDKMYASYVNFGRIRAWGLTSRASFNELNNIIRQNGVSPVFFWAYEGGEGYHSSLSFLNHFPANGSSPQEEARRTAAWVKETSLQNGSLAWYDAMYPYYTSPPDKQAVGNAYMADTQPGAIARVMLQGTAAATWAMFDPPALNASVNGVQDYADPFAHQMSLIKSWQSVSKYGRPMSSYTVTSEFGWRSSPFGGGMEFHNAIDLANGGGSPIMASNSGTVIRADANWFDWYGNYVVIRHPDGLYTGYAHLSQINVKIGQEVQKGQVVGLEGATGPVTGPHLHFQFMKRFEVVSNNDFENPRKYVDL
ncbi:phage tail spike protein [Vagococcus carniphilus]|uniref:phage tail spike protein n=1 Tax=Vagococcus carniphilus TaxID=218144 RepID=UPI0028921637|nr:phage tail spike protein [Vagococcus carniphilus]MDT2850183.1 phage tail spike protein [Vagococcus carniphilus]